MAALPRPPSTNRNALNLFFFFSLNFLLLPYFIIHLFRQTNSRAMEKFSFLLLTVTTAMLLALNVAAQNVAAPLRSLLDQAPSDCCSKLAAFGFTSTLPVVVIDSSARQIPYHEDTNITLCTCSKFKDYSGIAQAAIRGTSSANFTKKSFKVTTLNATDGKGLKFPFLGMPEDDDWILYGPELDATLGMRNYITYNLARASGKRFIFYFLFLRRRGIVFFNILVHFLFSSFIAFRTVCHKNRVL